MTLDHEVRLIRAVFGLHSVDREEEPSIKAFGTFLVRMSVLPLGRRYNQFVMYAPHVSRPSTHETDPFRL